MKFGKLIVDTLMLGMFLSILVLPMTSLTLVSYSPAKPSVLPASTQRTNSYTRYTVPASNVPSTPVVKEASPSVQSTSTFR